MSKYDLCISLLKWLQTFKLENTQGSYRTLDDIVDGVAIANVLHQIAPEWFGDGWLAKIKTEVGDNWRLKVSNLKKIVESVADYYQEFVSPTSANNIVKPDATKIGEHNDTSEIVKLLQLVLGCAVNCNNKSEYIQQIMSMEESVQNVIMQSIQELESLLGSTPAGKFNSSLSLAGSTTQIDQLMNELQLTNEARNQLSQRCTELDLQLNALHDEKNLLIEEKKKLEMKLQDLVSSSDPSKGDAVRKQIEALKEEIYKLETSRDDYRLKLEMQEKEMNELQTKFDSLQQAAAEARHLKDELDILREDADKVEKLELTLQTYKKKLEELSELKREMKQVEDKNLSYNQQIFHLEEELKKANAWKIQSEMYKKQVAELRNSLSEETKKLDKVEFENMKSNEKLSALEKEKERLVVDLYSLKEANEELLGSQLQQLKIGNYSSELNADTNAADDDFSALPESMMSTTELKREMVKLQHENTLLKMSRKQSEDDKLPVLQTLNDDLIQRNKQLEGDLRQANQRILQLEADIKEGSVAGGDFSSAVRDLQNQLQVEKSLRLIEISERERLTGELQNKEQEFEEMEERHRRYLEKARAIAKCFDVPELQFMGNELGARADEKVDDDMDMLQQMEIRLKQDRDFRETEEKLIVSAFYNFAQKRQQESMDQRLMVTSGAAVTGNGVPFLVRQRQSSTSKGGNRK